MSKRWKVLNGITYRKGDGWKRAEAGSVVDDLDDVSAEQLRAFQDQGDIEPAKARTRKETK